MRKLAMLGVLAVAMAWTARAEEKSKTQEAQQEVDKAKAEGQQEVGEAKAEAQKEAGEAKAEGQKEVGEAQAKANEKVGEAQEDAAKKQQEAAQQGTASGGAMGAMGGEHKHPVFTHDNWDVKGTVQSASKDALTVRRDDLPAAKLMIDKNTRIELGGEKVTAMQLKPGQEVKASFNLRNDKPVAVEIKAEKKE